MNFTLTINIGVTPELKTLALRFMGAIDAAEAASSEALSTEAVNDPQPEAPKRRGRPPRSAVQPDMNPSGSLDRTDAGSEAGSGATNAAAPETPAFESEAEETLADALGLSEGDDEVPSQKALEDKLQEVVDKIGDIKLIQQTLFAASDQKSIKNMPEEKRAAAIAALDKLLA